MKDGRLEEKDRERKGRSVEGGAQSDGGVLVLEHSVAGNMKATTKTTIETTIEPMRIIVPFPIPVLAPRPRRTILNAYEYGMEQSRDDPGNCLPLSASLSQSLPPSQTGLPAPTLTRASLW